MKNTIYFLLGIALIILTSATTVSVMTVKPAKPILTIILTTSVGQDAIKDDMYRYIQKGYIVKNISGTSQFGSHWIAVMEKY